MGVIFSGEEGLRHCKECDSPELFDGEINPYGYCFGCSDGAEEFGTADPSVAPPDRPHEPMPPDPRSPYWLRSGRHG